MSANTEISQIANLTMGGESLRIKRTDEEGNVTEMELPKPEALRMFMELNYQIMSDEGWKDLLSPSPYLAAVKRAWQAM